MRDIVKLSVRLMIFALISALMLATVNALTKDRIAKLEREKVNGARIAVLGDYDFAEVPADLTGSQFIKHIYAGTDHGKVKGYVYELESAGFGGIVSFSLGIDASGTVTGIAIASHSETKGLGTDQEKPFLSQFIGLSAADAGTGAAETAAPIATGTPSATAEAATGASATGTPSATAEAATGASATGTPAATVEAKTAASATGTPGASADANTGATTDGTTGATSETQLSGAAAGGAVAAVDGMTGATYSTNAIKNGVAEALAHFAANYLGGGAAQ